MATQFRDFSSCITIIMPAILFNDIAAFNELSTFIESRAQSSYGGDVVDALFRHVHKIKEKNVRKQKLLGSGAFCNVFEARDKNQHADRTYAIKCVKPLVRSNKKELTTAVTDLAIEAALLANIQHGNIISLYGVQEGDMHTLMKTGEFFIALECLEDTLEHRLQSWSKQWNRQRHIKVVDRIEHIAIGIVKGMEYLHLNHILFRDLKPSNIGFDKKTGQVKIFDFGLARTMRLEPNKTYPQIRLTKRTGSPRYMAPEIIRGVPYYDYAVDVYSFSILLWQLITTRTPFGGIYSGTQLLTLVSQHNHRPPLFIIEEAALKQLMQAGWADKPTKRPTFAQIRQELERYLHDEKHKKTFGLFGRPRHQNTTAAAAPIKSLAPRRCRQ
mmetsp:Transcript_3048/g.4621  ORF Transcript_3048/g.4621 Transcript_3048/m.4621 type:complete len:385 (-) Transcript_3048:557-1711(-)